jgi:hypothetical protein
MKRLHMSRNAQRGRGPQIRLAASMSSRSCTYWNVGQYPYAFRVQICFSSSASCIYRLPFYAVLDLSRLIVAFCPEAVKASGAKERLFDALFKAADWTVPWTKATSKPVEINMMLLLRALANVAQEASGAADGPWLGQVLRQNLFLVPRY